MTALRAIVFDWNCTLLDDFHAMLACMNIVMAEAGRPPVTEDFFRTHYDVPFERLYRNLGLKDDEIKRFMELDRNIFHHHYEPMADIAALRDGAREVLENAAKHGVETMILSNHIEEPIRVQLRRLGVHDHFTGVLAYADRSVQFVEMTKGEKLRRYRTARQVPSERTMIVGDSVEEIEIAKDQNLISVAITGGCVSERRLKAAGPDHLIHSLHELTPIMQERGLLP